MGLTTLSGKPLMRFVICKGVKYYTDTETRIDFTINSFGSSDNQQEFIENNLEYRKTSFKPLTGKGKHFPEGPTCMFKVTVVPCFTRWSECDGMTSNILKEIFEIIDHYNLLLRIHDVVPFAMLDVYGSRLKLLFIVYQ